MKPEFYVIRLGRAVDPNKMAVAAPPAPARAAPRAARQRDEIEQLLNPEVVPQDGGYGLEISRSELRDPVVRFTTSEAAERHAQELAEKSPKTLFAVLGVVKVFETTVPTVLEKRFNDKGELVLSENN